MRKYIILFLLWSFFVNAQYNLFARQNFAKSSSAPTYNTYIGGVSGTIATASALATKLGISVGAISNFTIVGSDIKCKITGSYAIPANAFDSNTSITYYLDSDYLVSSIGTQSFYNCSNIVSDIDFKNATSIGVDAFTGCSKVVNFYFDNITNISDSAFRNVFAAKIIYIPRCTSLGSTSGNNTVFQFSTGNYVIYTDPSLATNNAGSPDGDLTYAISQGATVRYVSNFTPPSAITTLTSGTIYNTAIQLNFTQPSSTNTIDFYQVYVDGVYNNKIVSSDGFAIGLLPSTNYNIAVYAVDIYLNKSLISNVLNSNTSSSAWDISTGLVSYYKMNSDSKDNFRINNGVNTSITYTTGKIGNASVYNGSSSLVTVSDSDNLTFSNASSDLPFSISYWIYASNTQFSIINKTGGAGREYECEYSGGKLLFRLISGANVSNRLDQLYTISMGTSTWIHVVHTYNGSGSGGMKTYINGSLAISTNTVTGTYVKMSNTTNPLIFGGLTTLGGYFLNGKLDEIAIYNMELTAGNVTSLYNSGSGITL